MISYFCNYQAIATFQGEQVNLALSLPRRPVFLDSAVDKNWQYQRALNIPTDVVENDSQFIFPTPPVAFETYRPIYNRVQNTFDQESYSNSVCFIIRNLLTVEINKFIAFF